MITKTLEYRDGRVTLKGFLAYDEKRSGPRPGVVVFPEALGLGQHAMERARRLAAAGYVALAADPYGDGIFVDTLPKAVELMTAVRSDVAVWRARAKAALDALTAQPQTDRGRLAAIGYCFGGSTALELARSGAPLGAVTSFHGGLESPRPDDARNIRAKVLVCHGALDPLVTPAHVAAFQDQMRQTKVDWELQIYGGATHSFTNPEAGSFGNPAFAYSKAADTRSWKAMLDLFAEVFGSD
ncbi:MAG TPA: dienelactone hydrolase family protein [Candidatus Cybelea sp.]|nr:dienelactone hydrolase family protein [Candidatus Cybelea sp.]